MLIKIGKQLIQRNEGRGDDCRRCRQVVGPQVHDARIAALCKQHSVTELWTVDRDFNRFQAISTLNPLVADA
jgi:predicted nucleic acid-binding protein